MGGIVIAVIVVIGLTVFVVANLGEETTGSDTPNNDEQNTELAENSESTGGGESSGAKLAPTTATEDSGWRSTTLTDVLTDSTFQISGVFGKPVFCKLLVLGARIVWRSRMLSRS